MGCCASVSTQVQLSGAKESSHLPQIHAKTSKMTEFLQKKKLEDPDA